MSLRRLAFLAIIGQLAALAGSGIIYPYVFGKLHRADAACFIVMQPVWFFCKPWVHFLIFQAKIKK